MYLNVPPVLLPQPVLRPGVSVSARTHARREKVRVCIDNSELDLKIMGIN